MDYPSAEIYFHPEMRGKCWITKNRIHLIGMCVVGYFSGLNTYLYLFHQAPKILQKEHKEWPSQLP